MTVFSAARYVEQFMTEPMKAAFSRIKFIEVRSKLLLNLKENDDEPI